MKDILSVTDLDKSDFIIKWRMTGMCNADCSYCIRKGRNDKLSEEKAREQNERLKEVASEISRMVDATDFENVKIDLIGGEVSVLDLSSICEKLSSVKIKQINITTNLLRNAEYYSFFCEVLHSKGIEVTATASFHYEYQPFEKYFEKIEELKKHFDILDCEMVSTLKNQNLCKKFINKCREIGIDYSVEGDLRFSKEKERQKGLITDSSRKTKSDRYKVCFTDGTECTYGSRNQFLMDSNNVQNVWQKAIHTKGFVCSNSNDFVYIDFDTVVGRTKTSNRCTTRMKIEAFEVVEPRICEEENCTLCGHMSLWRV